MKPIQIIEEAGKAYLSPKEQAKLDAQLEEMHKAQRQAHSLGPVPPFAVLPLLNYLPKEWTFSVVGSGAIAETLRAYGYTIVETLWDKSQASIIVPKFPLIELEEAYETYKAFAILLPLADLGLPQAQKMFQQHGVQMILMDRDIGRSPFAWFCWSLPGLTEMVTFTHIPGNEHLLEWMKHPSNRAAIRKGVASTLATMLR